MIEVLAHRGLWREPAEKNTLAALRGALAAGFGIETDVRDCDGTLVISHDPPRRGVLTLDELLTAYRELKSTAALALNIKADGLAQPLKDALARHGATNYFVFDMSIPDSLPYVRLEMPVYARQSEYEPSPALYNRAAGVWLDAFAEEWYTAATISAHLAAGKRVCLVSPELHKRPHEALWAQLREQAGPFLSRLSLCTDHPERCYEYFR